MTAAWPSTVPQEATDVGEDAPVDNVARWQPEVGPAKQRRRVSMDDDEIAFDSFMTRTEYEALRTFYLDDLISGTQPFTRKHPYDLSGSDRTFLFLDRPRWRAGQVNFGTVSMRVRCFA